ncbi:hypothetical protein NDU88_001851 [Pleurodeles waltl]|uniref:Uncharacterized protein n=1 Tax=Pleurodeles waltl TaxID=8319 RepID=A0AAV7UU05_PLEWA|nr:hypothetical protein NDU88_001851 [Pleurodeles waltl]
MRLGDGPPVTEPRPSAPAADAASALRARRRSFCRQDGIIAGWAVSAISPWLAIAQDGHLTVPSNGPYAGLIYSLDDSKQTGGPQSPVVTLDAGSMLSIFSCMVYQADVTTVPQQMEAFLSTSPFVKLSPFQKVALEESLQPEEIRITISQIACTETPGMDGLSIEYYATYSVHLVQPLLKVF